MTHRHVKSSNNDRGNVLSHKSVCTKKKKTLSCKVWEKNAGKSFFGGKQMRDETLSLELLCDKGFIAQDMNVYARQSVL